MKRDSWLRELIEQLITDRPEILHDEEMLSNVITDAITKSMPEASDLIYNTLKTNSGDMLEDHRLIRQEFEARLQRRWSKALNLLETIIVLSHESGEEFCEDVFDEDAEIDNLEVSSVIVRLHARACRVSLEVLTLLRAGYADGALARWRTLHEVSTTAFFIAHHGKDLAIRYAEYEDIERYHDMLEYQRSYEKLGHEKLEDEEVQEIIERKEELVKRYGEDFGKEYGWTIGILPKGKRTFKQIEASMDFSHWRTYFKLANNYVHSGPRGTIYPLGSMKHTDHLLPGASNYGLATPGQNTGISLVQITTCLLTIEPTYQRLLVAKVLQRFLDELCSEFVDTQKDIENEEMELRQL